LAARIRRNIDRTLANEGFVESARKLAGITHWDEVLHCDYPGDPELDEPRRQTRLSPSSRTLAGLKEDEPQSSHIEFLDQHIFLNQRQTTVVLLQHHYGFPVRGQVAMSDEVQCIGARQTFPNQVNGCGQLHESAPKPQQFCVQFVRQQCATRENRHSKFTVFQK
jgi:hypothetical protein